MRLNGANDETYTHTVSALKITCIQLKQWQASMTKEQGRRRLSRVLMNADVMSYEVTAVTSEPPVVVELTDRPVSIKVNFGECCVVVVCCCRVDHVGPAVRRGRRGL